jgi:diguanylate cyclase (GGDEF)-like protein
MLSTLKGKITLFSSLVIILTIWFVLYIVYSYGSEYFAKTSKASFKKEARLIGNDIRNALGKISKDVALLARTPPIQGIIRSSRNQGKDPEDNSTQFLWERRLASIFNAMLKVNPYYTQIRYIGVSNKGKEIVRVNRTKGEIYITDSSSLQNKSKSNYFQDTLKHSRGSIFFSNLEYNKDGGKLTYPLEPTLRVIMPIYDTKQIMFGMIVINVNIENYISQIFLNNNIAYEMAIISKDGKKLMYNPEKRDVLFDDRKGFSYLGYKNKKYYTIIEEIFSDKFYNDKIFTLYLKIPKAKLSFLNSTLLQHIVMWLILVTIFSVSLMYLFSLKIMSRLSEMAKLISSTSKSIVTDLSLPVYLNDEVGMLARAFEEKTRMLNNLAYFDSLTGLPNRKKIIEHLDETILRSKRNSTGCACLYIDLNDFKSINDNYGHDHGDELLVKFSAVLENVTRESDFCGRLGGDEFIVIIESLENDTDLAAVIERYQSELNTTFNIKGICINNTISGGLALYPDNATSSDELIKRADQAMFESKKSRTGLIYKYSI